MRRIIVDAETNGLLPHPTLKDKSECTKIHCIVLKDIDTGWKQRYRSDDPENSIAWGLSLLENLEPTDVIIGQNVDGYDLAVFLHLHDVKVKCQVLDTLVMSRFIYRDLWTPDYILRDKGLIPGQLMGRHSLEAWGHRLKMHKGDYSAEMKKLGLDPWAEINDHMVDYCDNDVELTHKLFNHLMSKKPTKAAMELEHAVHRICIAQEKVGVGFNEAGAASLYAELSAKRNKLEADLKANFGSWTVRLADFIPKRDNKKLGYVAGVAVERHKTIEFSPSSRDHIARVLRDRYKWSPGKFTDTGKDVISDDVLASLPFPEAKQLMEFLMLDKRVGQLSNGKEGWLRHVINGRIYGRINANGTITGRATHSSPNLGQVPNSHSPYGPECRELYLPKAGWVMVGADASGLELRCLAHYFAYFDGGAYAQVILTGDVHTANQQAAGLLTRDQAKTFIYALLYGAGDEKIGSIIGKGSAAGRKLKKKFMENLPAYAKLAEIVAKKAKAVRKLLTLDGQYLDCRSAHSALNVLLQGAGAVIMKKAMVNYTEALAAKGIIVGRDYNQVLWVHDEFQVECKPELAEIIGQAMVDGIRKVTQDYNLKCPLDGEFKIGKNWRETH